MNYQRFHAIFALLCSNNQIGLFTMLRLFSFISYSEGISYLVLFINMLIIKRIDIDLYQKLLFPIGITHGFLFIAYMVLALYLKFKLRWSFKKFVLIAVASLLPFGTFYSEAKWVNNNI
ncbi:DUF3817 domain-containing protein [Marinilongibacter aquaticus]|uniref:DUF3817 domain-containing protein n=1 Tax=Marinilongibacter aquaticus TaxID=2975157 RepID=UPI0021BDA086|nr:DUF3817 domain-containing protein [Marinilongibacter aquaticus]UBM59100.1 DUF3817 domain-containing protein [Marinilongibacter aquaticus]